MSDIDQMRAALDKVGLAADPVALDDEKVAAVALALLGACADFNVALATVSFDAPVSIGERFRRLADFTDEMERLAAQERADREREARR